MPRAWVAPILMGLLLAAVTITPIVRNPKAYGWDFQLFYAAGLLPGSELYDLEAQLAVEEQTWREHRREQVEELNFSPFLRPAYYRLLLVPLSRLPYWTAYGVWVGLQLVALGGALFLLGRRFGFDGMYWLLLLGCPYLWRALAWGQDLFLVLFCIAFALDLLARGREGAAGAVLALGLVKWNVLLLVSFVLLAPGRRKVLTGFAAAAAVEIAVSLAMIGPTGFADFFAAMQDPIADFLRAEMPSVRGLLLALGASDAVVVPLLIALSAALVWLAWRLPVAEAIALAVSGSVALGLHTMEYDLLLHLAAVFVFGPFGRSLAATAALIFAFSPISLFVFETARGPVSLKGPAGVIVLLVMAAYAWKRRLTRQAA